MSKTEQKNSEEIAENISEEKSKPKEHSVAKSAGIVSIAVMFSRVLGLVREKIFAHYFGDGFVADAFQAAFKLSNTLRDLFAEGALSAAFVKTFTDYQIKKSEAEAWRLASLVMNGLAVVLSVITLVGIFAAPYIIPLITKDFSPEKTALTITLTQIMFPFILLVALAAVAMGVLNTKGKFGVPASASTAFNIFSIIFGLAIAYWLSDGLMAGDKDKLKELAPPFAQWAIIGMAIGVLIGGAAQFFIQVPSLLKVGFKFRPNISFTDPGVRQVARLMAPAIIGTSAVQIKVFIDIFLLSGIEGGNSWLPYAFRFMQFPIGVFGVAIGTAAIPALSRLAAEGKIDNFRNTLSDAIKLVFFLTLPSACGLVVLGEPIIRLIYESGNFSETATQMTSWALIGYSVGLTGYAAIKVLSPSFYALDDVKTPMIVSLSSVAVYPIAGYFLMKLFSGFNVTPQTPNGLAHVGLTLATSVIALVSFSLLTFMMKKRISHINGGNIFSAFVKVGIASLIMSAVAYFVYHGLANYFGVHGFWIKLLNVFAPMALSGLAFVTIAKLLGIEEMNKFFGTISRKFGKA
ncbi:MAG: murein biosynthesis integral membrane protein MurJ [Pyrinomonadaceae bacterium]|jgi:putative peptidoglycan lipid II flippase|nr:murein biosynthesis integral membrane protein MurJ [Pyrinomonadaceae bacterium]